jgi:hypothetical protein
MGIDLSGNKLYSTSIGTKGEVIKQISTDGLVLHLDAGNKNSYGGSGTTWYDLTSNASNGTLYNSPTFNSGNNGSLVFNGTSTYVDVTNNLGVLAGYTVCYWAYRDTNDKMAVAARTDARFYNYGDNSWYYTHGGVAAEYYYPHAVSIPLGTWGFWCVTYNGLNVSIYRQGTYEGQQSTTGTADWTPGIKIGLWTSGNSYAFQGKIAIVDFYNRALSATEVKQNFNSQKSRFGL